VLCNASAFLAQIFEVVELPLIIRVFDTEQDAVQPISRASKPKATGQAAPQRPPGRRRCKLPRKARSEAAILLFARAGDGCEDEDLPCPDSDVGDRLGEACRAGPDSSSVSRGRYAAPGGVWLAAGWPQFAERPPEAE